MELKSGKAHPNAKEVACSNRTFMELKYQRNLANQEALRKF